jgi:hypothetical protein
VLIQSCGRLVEVGSCLYLLRVECHALMAPGLGGDECDGRVPGSDASRRSTSAFTGRGREAEDSPFRRGAMRLKVS